MSKLTLADVLAMTPEQCRDLVNGAGYTDPHPYMLGDQADPMYRAWIRAQRAA